MQYVLDLLNNSIVYFLEHAEGSAELRAGVLTAEPYMLSPKFIDLKLYSAYLTRVQYLVCFFLRR